MFGQVNFQELLFFGLLFINTDGLFKAVVGALAGQAMTGPVLGLTK